MLSNKSILIISPFFSPNIGGVETYLDDLVTGLRKKQWKIVVITYSPLTSCLKTCFYEKSKNLEIFRLPWIRFNLFYRLEKYSVFRFLYLFLGIFVFSFFYNFIFWKRFQIIHGHGLAAGLVSAIIGKCFSKKTVVSLHTIYKFHAESLSGKIAKIIFDKVDTVAVLSKKCKDHLISLGVKDEKIKVCHYWVDVSEIFQHGNKKSMRKKLKIDQNCFMILFVGRLTEEKGVRIVLKIIEQTNSQIQFFIVGDGPLRTEVESVAQKHKNVHFLGNMPSGNLPFWYSVADLLLWGSVDQDYVGRVTMHALSCGLPVILPSRTKYFGEEREVDSTIKNLHKKIWFVLSPNIKNVSHKLEKLSRKPKKLEKMSFRCRGFALKNYSEEKNIKAIIHIYQNFFV